MALATTVSGEVDGRVLSTVRLGWPLPVAGQPVGQGGPRLGRAPQQVALGERDPEPDERFQLGHALDPLGQHPGVELAGEAAQHLDQGRLGRVAVAAGDQRPVQLDQVGAEQHQVLEAGVAGAGVVDGQLGVA
jgi:hypothetical protein